MQYTEQDRQLLKEAIRATQEQRGQLMAIQVQLVAALQFVPFEDRPSLVAQIEKDSELQRTKLLNSLVTDEVLTSFDQATEGVLSLLGRSPQG